MCASGTALTEPGIAGHVRALQDEAVSRHGVPGDLAEEAATITRNRFSHEFERGLSPRDRARMSAYFQEVIRRRVIASRGENLSALRSRFILSSLAVDLKRAGRSGPEIFREIEQQYAGYVEQSVLEEFAQALCV